MQYEGVVANEASFTRQDCYMSHGNFGLNDLGNLELAKARCDVLLAIRYNPADIRLNFCLLQTLMEQRTLLLLRKLKRMLV